MASSDKDLSLADPDASHVSPLLKTLDELNRIDIVQIEKHVGRLWDELHANFDENRDSSITGGSSFIVWALNNVERPLLCRILDREHKAVLQSITPDIQGRLTALADRWDASPGLFFALFTHKIISSRACIDLLNGLRKASPDLLLTDFVNQFNGVSRHNNNRYGPRAMKNAISMLKEAVGHFDPALVERKHGPAMDPTPPESASSSNAGDKDGDEDSDSIDGKHLQDTRRPLPTEPGSVKTGTPGGDAANGAPVPNIQPIAIESAPLPHPQVKRKQAPTAPRVDLPTSPERPRRERQTLTGSPASPKLLSQLNDDDELGESLFGTAPSIHDSDDDGDVDFQNSESDLWSGPSPFRAPQVVLKPGQDAQVLPNPKRRRLTGIGLIHEDVTNDSLGGKSIITNISISPSLPGPKSLVRDRAVIPRRAGPAFPFSAELELSPNPVIKVIQREDSPGTTQAPDASAEMNSPSTIPFFPHPPPVLKYRSILEEITDNAYRLSPGQMLNDTIINTLLNRLSSVNPKVLAISSLVLGSQNIPDRVFDRIAQGNYDKILMPVCRDCHWVLFVYFRQDNKVRLFDSRPGVLPVDEVADAVVLPFLRRMSVANGTEVDLNVNQCPRQQNGVDCGLFVLLFAYHVSEVLERMPTDVTSETLDSHRQHFLQCLLTSADAALPPDEIKGVSVYGKAGGDRLVSLARYTLEFRNRRFTFQLLLKSGSHFSDSTASIRQLRQDEGRRWETDFIASALDKTHASHARHLQDAIKMQCERRERREAMGKCDELRTAIDSILKHVDPKDPKGPSIGRSGPALRSEAKVMMNLRCAADMAADFFSETCGSAADGNPDEQAGHNGYNPFTICVVHIIIARFARQKLSSIKC